MEVIPPVKVTLFKSLERKEPVVKDNSSINEFKNCPRRFFFRMILGYKEKYDQPYFAWGSAIHKFAETYVGGKNLDDEKATDKIEKFNIKESLTEGMRIWLKSYPNGVSDGKWSFFSAPRLMKSMIALQKDIDLEVKSGKFEYLKTEQSFDLELPSGRRIGGRADRIDRWNGKIWGRDFKTTSQDLSFYDRGLNPNSQINTYTWAESKLCGDRVFGQLITVIFNKAPTKSQTTESQIGPIIRTFVETRTVEQIDDWVKETEGWLDFIDYCREHDLWPKNERQCKYCPYARVCRTPNEFSALQELTGNFKYSPWDHTRVEQED